mmetsp:Transcript_22362/g.66280  ORF Transcript_22362/g.66280 Transcript_22362/m.66280 type:complete len:160 (-) Transcript_22362:331-810(-)
MGGCFSAYSGRLPARTKQVLENENITLIDEGVTGTSSVHSQNFYHKTCIMATVVVTKQRFAIFAFGAKPLMNIGIDDERLQIVDSSVTGIDKDRLIINFDGSKFRSNESFAAQFGDREIQVEVSLHTSKAYEFYQVHQMAKTRSRYSKKSYLVSDQKHQ